MPNLDARLSTVDRNALKALLNPMLKLRQSCCHPQVWERESAHKNIIYSNVFSPKAVRGQFLNMQNKTAAMTMEDLLDQMVKKVVLESEEFHR